MRPDKGYQQTIIAGKAQTTEPSTVNLIYVSDCTDVRGSDCLPADSHFGHNYASISCFLKEIHVYI